MRVTLCAASPEEPRSKMVWAPARFGGTGPCFAVSETSGMLQMLFRLKNGLAFAVPWPRMFVSDVQNAFPLWHVGRLRRLILVKPGSPKLVRRSHGYPGFMSPVGAGRRLRRLCSAR